jgi:hypothetical protein
MKQSSVEKKKVGHSEVAMTHTIEESMLTLEGTTIHMQTLSQVYQNSKVTMKAYAMDVHKGRTSRTHFQRRIARQKES